MKIVYNFTKFIKFTYFPVWDDFFSYSSLIVNLIYGGQKFKVRRF